MPRSRFPYEQVAPALLNWYRDHYRSLPWRDTHDPYRIWVSEIMLQQTQVATVIPYYERFLKRFPTVKSLGNAPIDEVLKLWEGLGYYRRARQMHAAAQKIIVEHNGVFPQTFESVLELPGIGRYTAGAILSFAFDRRLPIVEANTLRLYSRLIKLTEPPQSRAGQLQLWEFAEKILPEVHPGQMNQALMELGSQVCTPREPACLLCPLSEWCGARKAGLQDQIPGRVKKITYEAVTEYALAIRDRQRRVWLRQRTATERWAGLWDFPRYTPESLTEYDAGATAAVGFEVTVKERLATLQHGVTRYRITLHLDEAEIVGRTPRKQSTAGWYEVAQVAELALTTPARRLMKYVT